MSNGLVNTRDQQFLLFEQFKIDGLFEREPYADFSTDIALMMMSEAEKMAVNVILPTYAEGDREGCHLDKTGQVRVPKCFHDAFKKFCEGGWLAAVRSPEVGGQGMPVSLYTACSEFFGAANFAFLMYSGLTSGAAHLIELYGTEEMKNKYMYRMYSGEWGGTMCLTEPGAGSDVGALKTTAKRLPDGKFLITGTKCFISSGDQDLTTNIIHPVLARIEGDPPGTAGISIFIVPKIRVNDDGTLGEPNDVKVGNVEHKMGIKGSATCTLIFGEDGKCVGELLGKEREGMRIMFNMMNEARLEVGMQALGHASAAYEHAVQYAKERIQSTPVWEMKNPDAKAVPIIMHPDVRRDLLWMKAMVEGIRAINFFAAYALDMAKFAQTPEDRAKYLGFAELMTPICKAYSSDMACLVTSKAIDVYGGYGYCQEYPVEQYMRDVKIACIYEGTNGIQALDLVGRKLGQNQGKNVMNMAAEVQNTINRAKAVAGLKQYAAKLEEAYFAFVDLTMTFASLGKSSSFLIPILNASPYLELFGDVLVGHFLLWGAEIAQKRLEEIFEAKGADTIGKRRALVHEDPEVAYYEGKVAAAKFFAAEVLPTVKARCEVIKQGEKIPIEMAIESF